MKTLYDSYLSILWDGSLDRGWASTLIMIHGVCKRFWLNILQSKRGTHCSSDKIISHTLSKWKPFIVLGWKFSCKMGEHYKKRKRKLSLLKFSYQSICVTHYVLEAHILGSARCFCAIARSSFSLHATANAKVSRIVLEYLPICLCWHATIDSCKHFNISCLVIDQKLMDKPAKHSLPPVLCVARVLPNQWKCTTSMIDNVHWLLGK